MLLLSNACIIIIIHLFKHCFCPALKLLIVSTAPLAGGKYSLQHTLGNLHVLHGDNLSQLLQAVHIADLLQELHTAVRGKRCR